MSSKSKQEELESMASNDDSSYQDHAEESDNWVQTFQSLVARAYNGNSIDRNAMALYRKMRMDIAKGTANAQFPLNVRRATLEEARGAMDPLAVASYLDAPLLVPFHRQSASADGDLGSECFRRCRFPAKDWLANDESLGRLTAAAVIRDVESTGYRFLAEPTWQITIVGTAASKGRKSPDLTVPQARKAADKELSNMFKAVPETSTANKGHPKLIVMNGLPFCFKGMPAGTFKLAAALFLNALENANLRAVIVGRHATSTYNALREAGETKIISKARDGKKGSESYPRRAKKQTPTAKLIFLMQQKGSVWDDFEAWLASSS